MCFRSTKVCPFKLGHKALQTLIGRAVRLGYGARANDPTRGRHGSFPMLDCLSNRCYECDASNVTDSVTVHMRGHNLHMKRVIRFHPLRTSGATPWSPTGVPSIKPACPDGPHGLRGAVEGRVTNGSNAQAFAALKIRKAVQKSTTWTATAHNLTLQRKDCSLVLISATLRPGML